MLAKINRVFPVYSEGGTVSNTIVDLNFESTAGGGYLPISLKGNVSKASNDELIKLALEELYNQLFPNRAENEKFNEVNTMLTKMEEAMTKYEERMKVMQGAFLEFMAEVYAIETEEATEETPGQPEETTERVVENELSTNNEAIIEE